MSSTEFQKFHGWILEKKKILNVWKILIIAFICNPLNEDFSYRRKIAKIFNIEFYCTNQLSKNTMLIKLILLLHLETNAKFILFIKQ